MPEITARWSGGTISKGPGNWTASIIYDCFGYASVDDAREALESLFPKDCPFPRNTSVPMFRQKIDMAVRSPVLFTGTVSWAFTAAGTWDDPESPLLDLVRYRWQIGNTTVPIDRDINGNAIVNSAGDAPDTPPSIEKGTLFLTVRRNEATFAVSQAITYQNTLNSGAIVIPLAGSVTAGQIRCASINPATEITDSQIFVPVEYVFELRADKFDVRFLDWGMRANYSGGVGEVFDNNGNRSSHPVLLDGTGKILPSGYFVGAKGQSSTSGTTPTGATVESIGGPPAAAFLHYQGYKSMDFTAFGFFTGA